VRAELVVETEMRPFVEQIQVMGREQAYLLHQVNALSIMLHVITSLE
jgi:hypothetical protein